MTEVNAPQRSKEWFEARKRRITGSMVGAILGVNPYMTPEDAMRTMVREALGAEREFTGNVATEWGSHHEEGAEFEYTLLTGRTVTECGFFEYEDWLGASPDGLLGDGGVLEIKCPFGIRNDEAPTFKRIKEELPYYYAQVQIEMLCTDRSYCHFYQWTPHGEDLQTINACEEWRAENIPLLKMFYEDFLLELKNGEHLQPKRPKLNKRDAVLLVEEIDDLDEALERAKLRRAEAMAELVELAGNRDVEINGRKLTSVKKAGSISYSKIVKKLRPKGLTDKYLDKFRGKPSSYWKLT